AEGWYVLSIMFRSGDFAVKSPRRCALSTPDVSPVIPAGSLARVSLPCRESPDALHHPARGRRLREPSDGAADRFAVAADRRRFRLHGGLSLDIGGRLTRLTRLNPS